MPLLYDERLKEFAKVVARRKLDAALVFGEANIRALTGVACDAACLVIKPSQPSQPSKPSKPSKPSQLSQPSQPLFFTDFRYVPMVHRVAPELKVRDIRRLGKALPKARRIGYEGSLSHARFLKLQKDFRRATFVDVLDDLVKLRSVKTADEIDRLRAAEALNDVIWNEAKAQFRPGMTEREMANVIRHLMIDRGEGEAFETIVCVGKNAAECHHVPDDTVWNGREPVLVDMGVKLDGFCSDMTRNIVPKRPRPIYRQIYDLVLKANLAAIAAAKPGITGRALDKVARDVIRKGGFGKCFGHSLGHGVGFEIHEAPTASKRDKTVLRPGMAVTIEPGVYLEDNLGVRIEDLVLITDTGCEVLSHSEK